MKNKVEIFRKYIGFSCNVYVLSTEKGTILVDPGFYDKRIRDYLNECGGLDAVLLTHGHWDHIYGLDRLMADFPEAKAYHHVLDAPVLRDPHLNCSESAGFAVECKTRPHALVDGAYLIAGYYVRVVHTPGHSVGSCVYVFPEEEVAFTGDSAFMDGVTTTRRPTGSEEDLRVSIEKLRRLPLTPDGRVYCGHYTNGTYGELLAKHPLCFLKESC